MKAAKHKKKEKGLYLPRSGKIRHVQDGTAVDKALSKHPQNPKSF